MKKKVFAIILIVCLVAGAAFAKKGDILVGAQLGYGRDAIHMKGAIVPSLASAKGTLAQNGFYFTATGEYGVTDAVYAKAELGILAGKCASTVESLTTDYKETFTYDIPVNFLAYLGAEFKLSVNDDISVLAGAGLDMAMGKITENNEEGDFRLGLGLEATCVYAINKDLSVKAGARVSVIFVDSNPDLQDLYDLGDNHFHYGLKIFAGCTYTL